MGQYHYTVLLYLCLSAATGVVQPAKSGSSSRSLSVVESTSEISEDLGEFGELGERKLGRIELNAQVSNDCSIGSGTDELNDNSYPTSSGFSKWSPQVLDGLVHLRKNYKESSNAKHGISDQEEKGIQVSVDLKRDALKKGFEIYEKMCLESVPMNEATLTSLARMAMSMGNGDMAFDTVKKMKELGISPRLRSYGPALSVFIDFYLFSFLSL